jgi:hypothetical protein
MREKLNSNPLAQIAVVGVLLVLAGVLILSSMGGGGSESATTTTSTASLTTPAGSATVTATLTTPSTTSTSAPAAVAGAPEVPPPPLPRAVTAAFGANRTIVLLVVKRGAIDNGAVLASVRRLDSVSGVSVFVVPADKLAHYVAITQGVKVERVPALVVVRPKRLDHGIATASVSYGFQSPENVRQAVRDARYRGHTLAYHP